MADNLPPSSADVTESGSLNLAEPSGPHRAVMGMLYLYLWYVNFIYIGILLKRNKKQGDSVGFYSGDVNSR
jgi:hypothetical protein